MRTLRLLAAIPLSVLCVACANLKMDNPLGVKRPTANVRGMQVNDVTANGFTMLFDMEFENPNGVALPMAEVDYKLKLAGSEVVQGKTQNDTGKSIPANGALPVQFPVNVTFQNLLDAGSALSKSGGRAPYELGADFEFESSRNGLMPAIHVPLKYSGTVDLKELLRRPGVLIQSEAARKLAGRLLMDVMGR